MKDVVLALPGIALTIVCWGAYGSVLHRGQALLGDRLKPLMCVGLAYVIFAIILPTRDPVIDGQVGWRLEFSRHQLEHGGRDLWRVWRVGDHSGVGQRWQTDLRDAVGVRWSADCQRPGVDVLSGAQTARRRGASPVLSGRSHHGRHRCRDGPDLRTQGTGQGTARRRKGRRLRPARRRSSRLPATRRGALRQSAADTRRRDPDSCTTRIESPAEV